MVIQKSDLKTWTNARGNGKLLNVTLMDNTVSINLKNNISTMMKNLLNIIKTF